MTTKLQDDDGEFWNSEDFWNTSTSSTFNFDDDNDGEISNNFTEQLTNTTDNLFDQTREENTQLQITSIISKECLTLITDDNRSYLKYTTPPIEESVKKMFYGNEFVLDVYRTLDDKLSILDAALNSSDGNIIITVILFLKKTLKPNVFLNNLTKRKIAIKHYANYLIMKDSLNELADLYMLTGNTSNMKDIYFLICKNCCRHQSLHRKLEQFSIDHSMNVNGADEIKEHTSFIKWQIDNNEYCESVIGLLVNLCKNNQDKSTSELKNLFKIDDYQYEWSLMNVFAKLNLWNTMVDTFIRNNWLTKKFVLNTVIYPETFAIGLSKHKPPKHIFEQFLQCVNDTERCLFLARKMEIHKVLINYYINQRDRISLLDYKNKSNLNVEELTLITKALEATDKKWKN